MRVRFYGGPMDGDSRDIPAPLPVFVHAAMPYDEPADFTAVRGEFGVRPEVVTYRLHVHSSGSRGYFAPGAEASTAADG